MKKLLLGTYIILMAASCSHTQNNQNQESSLSQRNLTTLNGIDSSAAKMMIDTFKKYKDNDATPWPTSVWFSKESIHSIDSLLHAEIAVQKATSPARKDTTDGIRLYFVCDPLIRVPHLKTSILLVSTYDSSNYPAGKSMHRDYYQHNASFLNGKIGNVSNDKNVPGALLFNPNYVCAPSTANCGISPDHLITCEQAHSWVQNSGKVAINTISEWFDLKVIDYFDKEIHNNINNPDGLRIYFAFRDKDDEHPTAEKNRHVFVFITTKNVNEVHTDYFECEEIHKLGGDNGELCPSHCN